jgi:spermidine synthase
MAATRAKQIPFAEPGAPILVKIIATCFVFSGASALIYEVLWARMLGLVFGATTIAISAVLTAFMSGLALGSAIAARVAKRSRAPLRAYALMEIAVGLYALIVPFLFRGIDQIYAAVWQRLHPGFYGFAFARFVLAALVLVIPTALMGATLPVLVAAVRQFGEYRAATVARLYALNLAGAIIGVIVAGFFLLPSLGVSRTIWIAAITNLAIGVAAFLADRKAVQARVPPSWSSETTGKSDDRQTEVSRKFWLLCAFSSGLITIGMQVVWSRVLAMIIGSSTYAFTIVLALFLIGLALGAWIVSANANTDLWSLRRWILWTQILIAVTLFLSLRITNLVPALLVNLGFRLGINSWPGLLVMQLLGATALILLPAILMGMIMPLVLIWAGRAGGANAEDSPAVRLVGQTYAVNTIGAIVGAIITSFLLIPLTSTRFTVFCAAALGVAVAGIAYEPKRAVTDRALARSLSAGSAVVLIIMMLLFWPRLNLNALSVGAYDSFVRVLAKARGGVPENEQQGRTDDHQLLMYEEGRTATVSVRRDWGITSVAINGRTNASDADDMPTQVMLGELGMLTAPRIENVLMVGLATGVTTGSVLQSPIESVECVEIEPAAIASSRFFDHVNNRPLSDPRLHLIVDDARTYLRVNPAKYDVIISEPSHPWVPGVANLFTREFFKLGRDRLRQDGVFVQWLQIYQLSTESLRSVLATFHETFPHVAVFRMGGAAKGKDLILLGSHTPITFDRIDQRMKEPRVLADLNRVGLNTPNDVTAWFVCDESQLGPAVKDAIINTDDNLHVETVAPREAFRPSMEDNSAWIEKLRLPKTR